MCTNKEYPSPKLPFPSHTHGPNHHRSSSTHTFLDLLFPHSLHLDIRASRPRSYSLPLFHHVFAVAIKAWCLTCCRVACGCRTCPSPSIGLNALLVYGSMAAVCIPPPSQQHSTMTSRRVPLSSIPNATNSPRRGAAAAASKRPRSFSSQQRDIPYGQGPPPKKQIVEFEQSLRSPTKQRAHLPSDGRALSRGVNNGGSATLLERKRLAAVERQAQSRTSRAEKTERENREHIIQWQKHYRSLFPEFVFYFESIPEEVRAKCSKQITSLGAVCQSPILYLCTI